MNATPPAPRNLVNRPVAAIGGIVRRFPALVVALIVVITGLMVVLSGQAPQPDGGDGVMPDVPEITAADTLSELFGEESEEVMQILVRTDSDTLVGADGHTAAAAIEAEIRSSGAGDRIADIEGRPGVVSWLFPAQLALDGGQPVRVDDAAITTAYEAALAELPNEQAGFASTLLPEGAGVSDADSALMLVILDTSDLPDDPTGFGKEMTQISNTVADAVGAAALPPGLTAEPFSGYLLFSDDGMGELGILFAAAFGIIMLILAFVYWVRPGMGMTRVRSARRSAADMLLSMAAIVMAILWMMGTATLLGPGFLEIIGFSSAFTEIIPILLIGLGVDYALHLNSRYREELASGASVASGLRGAIGTVGGALALATIATAVGFLTNVFNPLPTLGDFGILAAVGIVAAFLITLTFVPAARLLLDRRAERLGRLPAAALGQTAQRLLPSIMARTAVLAEKVPAATLAVTVLLAGMGLFGMTRLETRFSQIDFVPQDSPYLATMEELTSRFSSGLGETTDVLLTGAVDTPAAHNALVAVHRGLSGTEDVVVHAGAANAESVVTLLAGLMTAESEGQPAHPAVAEAATAAGVRDDLTVAEDADVAALYTALAEADAQSADQLIARNDAGAIDHARITVQTTAGEDRAALLGTALNQVLMPLETAGVAAVATSEGIMTHAVVKATEESQVSSLAITLLVAMLLLVAVFAYERRRPGLGVITMIPVVLVVLWTFGMMALTGIPFGPITATIAALAIGIGLPYSIHVVHRFTEDRQRYGNLNEAIRSTVRHTGGAMAGSAFTTMAGFGILVTSSFLPFRQLGLVMVYAVGLSLIAATLVLPSILVLWDRWHSRAARGEDAFVPTASPAAPEDAVASALATARIN